MSLRHLLAASAGLAALSLTASGQETEPPAEPTPIASEEAETETPLTDDGKLDLDAMLAAAKEQATLANDRLVRERAETAAARAETAAARAETERVRAEVQQERAETAATQKIVDTLRASPSDNDE